MMLGFRTGQPKGERKKDTIKIQAEIGIDRSRRRR
jgi:hypothetical protein